MMRCIPILATFTLTLLSGASEALANDADKDACSALDEGAECAHHTGDAGTCVPDVSDPGVLTCEDNADETDGAGSGGGGDGSCAGLDDGDACTRADGSAGTCVPDTSDPGVLECEDVGDGSASGGGNASGGDGDDEDGVECEGLEVGDACMRDDGREGTCKPDDSDPGALECDDDSAASESSGSPDDNSTQDMSLSCSVDPERPLAAGLASLLVLMGFGARRRRKAV